MFGDLLVSKARKPKFELILRIYDLNNVPQTNGSSFIKWHLPSSTAAEHRGRTDRCPIRNHIVSYEYVRTIPLRLTISKDNTLSPTIISFEVVQDFTTAGRPEKITVGRVELNLAEYVEEGEVRGEDEEGVVRRYLLQEAKINSTLKIGIGMRQVDGERNFTAPPLKTAPVFGGIAGIMAGEQEEGGDVGHMPNLSKGREHGELQDMYRRSLAASWAAHSHEMTADQCVEDIFNGGNGWKLDGKGKIVEMGTKSGHQTGRAHGHERHGSGHLAHRRNESDSTLKGRRGDDGHRRGHSGSQETLAGTGPDSEEGSERGAAGYKSYREVDEFDVREDLIAWKLPDGTAT